MNSKKTIASSSAALFVGAGLAVAGCGIFGGSDEDTGDGGGGKGGGGTAGNAGVGTGGSVTGGVSGTGPTGGSITGGTGTGGSITGGTGGSITGGAGGAGGAGGSAGAAGPFSCAMPKVANCGAINDFGTAGPAWGMADFSGGISVFGAGVMRATDTAALHITGMVTGYGHGFNIWFSYCSSLAAYTGVTFTISGTTTATTMMNTIDFQLQTNTDYPWQPRPQDMKGGCTAPAGMDPYGVCISPTLNVMLSPTATPAPQTVTWAQMMGGMPTAWSATMSPAEIIGIQWQFPWSSTATAYTVDVTLDNVQFTGGTGPTTACPPYMAGGGGMGGAGGGGGGTPGGGAGGVAAGAGGAGGVAAGAGGRSGGAGGT